MAICAFILYIEYSSTLLYIVRRYRRAVDPKLAVFPRHTIQPCSAEPVYRQLLDLVVPVPGSAVYTAVVLQQGLLGALAEAHAVL